MEVVREDVPMASTSSPSASATDQLVDVVVGAWQANVGRGDAPGGLLRRSRPAADLVALGGVREDTGAVLSRWFRPLATTANGRLVVDWSRWAALRADESRWPRIRHPKQGRASVRPTGDLSHVVAQ